MKPFNLKKAQNGEPVCRKDGRPAKILDFNFNGRILYKWFSESQQKEHTQITDINGRVERGVTEEAELRMATKTAWATIYEKEYSQELYCGKLCSTREEAEKQKEIWIPKMKKFGMAKIELIEEEEEQNERKTN